MIATETNGSKSREMNKTDKISTKIRTNRLYAHFNCENLIFWHKSRKLSLICWTCFQGVLPTGVWFSGVCFQSTSAPLTCKHTFTLKFQEKRGAMFLIKVISWTQLEKQLLINGKIPKELSAFLMWYRSPTGRVFQELRAAAWSSSGDLDPPMILLEILCVSLNL